MYCNMDVVITKKLHNPRVLAIKKVVYKQRNICSILLDTVCHAKRTLSIDIVDVRNETSITLLRLLTISKFFEINF